MYRVQGLGTEIGLKFETLLKMDYLVFKFIMMILLETRIAFFSTFMFLRLVFIYYVAPRLYFVFHDRSVAIIRQ